MNEQAKKEIETAIREIENCCDYTMMQSIRSGLGRVAFNLHKALQLLEQPQEEKAHACCFSSDMTGKCFVCGKIEVKE